MKFSEHVCPSVSFQPKKPNQRGEMNWQKVRRSHRRQGRLCFHPSWMTEGNQAGRWLEAESRSSTVPIESIALILCKISWHSRQVVTPLRRRQIYAILATDNLQKLLIRCIIHRAGSWFVFITLFLAFAAGTFNFFFFSFFFLQI